MEIAIIPYGSEMYFQGVSLRNKLLREPLGLVLSDNDLQKDEEDYQIGFLDNQNKLKGIVILTPYSEKSIKMRQLAIDPDWQGKGFGKKLVNYAEQFSRERKFKKIILDARKHVVPFYEKMGYHTEGSGFIKVTIPHVKMVKAL